MRNILFAVFDRFSHDQRALETIQSLSLLGNVTVVSYDIEPKLEKVKFIVAGNGKKNYLDFKRKLKKAYNDVRPDLVFLHDNYTAFFINWIRKRNKKIKIGYDSSELYYDKLNFNIKGLKSLLLQYQERKYINMADFILSANVERAMIMKDLYKLSKLPIIWDNVHRIDDKIDSVNCEKYANIFNDNKNIIFYCGGIHHNRGTFELIKCIENLGKEYKLVIAGTASEKEKMEFDEVYRKSKEKNFVYIGFISRAELRYCLKKSKISVSIFDFSCVNHIFCASGKIYESLFENVPILTSLNPPFKRLCTKYGVGISTNDYEEGIRQIINNYEEYIYNVKKYTDTIDYDNRVEKLKNIIRKEL